MGIQSFFSSASGLEAHSTWLDVIGTTFPMPIRSRINRAASNSRIN
jgi:hypothetical protein